MTPPPTPESTVSVELYVRSLAPRAGRRRMEETVRRLATLEDRDEIGEYRVYVTGKTIPASPAEAVTDFGAFLCNRIAAFRDWADRTGHSLEPRFTHRAVDSAFTGERYHAVAAPELLLAEYVDGDLRFVAPCDTDGTQVAVADRLARLAEAPTAESDRLERARADPPPEFSTVGQSLSGR